MRFYLDSAAADDIRQAAAWPWVAGVTTNPAILARAGLRSVEPVLAAAVAGGRRDWTVWAQLPDGSANDTVQAAFALREGLAERSGGFFAGPTLVAKLLPRPAHLWAAARLAAEGVAVCVTGVTNAVQALAVLTLPRLDEGWDGGHATEGPPGSRNPNVPDWIAAYVGRLDDAGRDGIAVVAGMAAAYRTVGARTRVLAGSVRDAAMLAALAGRVGGGRGDGLDVTLSLDLLRGALDDPVTAAALAQFAEIEAQPGA
jgi:transaldolase